MAVKITAVASYHPDRVVDNDYFRSHFKRQGVDIDPLLKVFGRDERYLADKADEDSCTMAIEAAERVLAGANISPLDIDMLVFSSQTPEYLFPSTAAFIHHSLGLREDAFFFDSNANCAGMLVAVEQAVGYMSGVKRVKRALIVGCDTVQRFASETDPVAFTNFGDAASAIILESTDEDKGFIDSRYYTRTDLHAEVLFPAHGLSEALSSDKEEVQRTIQWNPFDGNAYAGKPATEIIQDLLDQEGLKASDVGAFCFSQFGKSTIELLERNLKIPEGKAIFVGDEYGYTGTSSPFLAFERALEEGKLRPGDYVVFWSIGVGMQMVALLFKV